MTMLGFDIGEPDLNASAFKADPYVFYRWLRTCDPIHHLTLPSGRRAWLITRYEDAVAALKDQRFIKDFRKLRTDPGTNSSHLLHEHLIGLDPPNHTRLRSLISHAFTPHMIVQWRAEMSRYVNTLIDDLERKGDRHDLVEAFAFPFSLLVITNILGVPAEDRHQFHRWSAAIVESFGNPDASSDAQDAIEQFAVYLRHLIKSRREGKASDLIGELIATEEQGDRLSESELVASLFQLLVAGHETTAHFIGNAMLALLTHPEQMRWLADHPFALPSAIDELLRYQGSVNVSSKRWASTDVELGGKLISKGEAILVALIATNHDPEVFSCPEELDLARPKCKHLAFGHGIHYCLGASLARAEAEIAIGTLLRRLPQLRLDTDPHTLRWRPGLFMLGLEHLPVAFASGHWERKEQEEEPSVRYLYNQSGVN